MGEKQPQGMDFVTQLNELEKIGFDGIKMIEGKPTSHRTIGKNLLNEEFDKFFAEAEKRGTHITFHVSDPKEFWENEGGDYYGDPTFATYDEINRQAYKILETHPNLKVTFAHFFFKSETPKDLIDLFEKYPNVCVDLTPGWEMYLSFYENKEYFKEFMTKYSKRILLGTDATFPWETKEYSWCLERLYNFITKDSVENAFYDKPLTGLMLTGEDKENILYKNFERRVGRKEPKEINKEALLAYFEKYKELLDYEEYRELSPLVDKYLR
jgi:predicted TIM-barrel fold metal-dependent hydrolase